MKHLKLFEELNTSNTYFTKATDITQKLEGELNKAIESICDQLKITLPTEPWSKDFLSIKKQLIIKIKENKLVEDYFEKLYLSDEKKKKMIDDILLKFCTKKETSKKVPNNNKLNITHLDFKLVDKVDNIETYQVIFPEDIKKYIQSNYTINKLDYLIYVNCEFDNFNRLHFPGRIERWYRSHGKRFGKDEQPQPYIGKHGKNVADLFDGIPKSLRGTGLGYAIYKEFIKFKGYVSSSSWSGILSQSVWKKLATDPDLYGILVNYKDQDGNIILFSKSYKGDYKKICQDFISKAKQGKLYRGEEGDFEITSIDMDEDLKRKMNQ